MLEKQGYKRIESGDEYTQWLGPEGSHWLMVTKAPGGWDARERHGWNEWVPVSAGHETYHGAKAALSRHARGGDLDFS